MCYMLLCLFFSDFFLLKHSFQPSPNRPAIYGRGPNLLSTSTSPNATNQEHERLVLGQSNRRTLQRGTFLPGTGSTALFLRDPVIRTVVTDSAVAVGLKNISVKDVVVGEVAVVDAAAERIASIVLTVGPTPLSRSQPYPVAPLPQILHVEEIVFDYVSLRSLVPHRPTLPTISVKVDSAERGLQKPVSRNDVGSGTVDSHHLTP